MKVELGKLAKGVSSEETDAKNPGFIDKIVNSLNKIQRESFIIKGNGLILPVWSPVPVVTHQSQLCICLNRLKRSTKE